MNDMDIWSWALWGFMGTIVTGYDEIGIFKDCRLQAEFVYSQLTVATAYIAQSHCTALPHSTWQRYKSTAQMQIGKSMNVWIIHATFTRCGYPDLRLGLSMRSTQCLCFCTIEGTSKSIQIIPIFCHHFPHLNVDSLRVNGPSTKKPGLDHWCILVPCTTGITFGKADCATKCDARWRRGWWQQLWRLARSVNDDFWL